MNRVAGLASAVPVLILVLFFAIAVGLMLAGYGVAVAVGVLAGLVLGGVIGGTVGLWLGVRGRGRSVTVGGMSMTTDGDGPPAAMREFMGQMERVQRVDHGELLRVIPGGVTGEANGVRVEMIALELRSSGGVAFLAAVTEPPVGLLGSFGRVSVQDDIGTEYVAALMGGNSSPDRSRFDLRFAPAPPPIAAILRVRIDEFADPFAPMGDRPGVVGPWLLSVALADESSV